jgi:hypothetical protein
MSQGPWCLIYTFLDNLLSYWVANRVLVGGVKFLPLLVLTCPLVLCWIFLSLLIMGCHVWLQVNPSSLLKLSGCSWILITSFTKWSMYLVAFPSLEVPLKSVRWAVLIECSAAADFFSFVCYGIPHWSWYSLTAKLVSSMYIALHTIINSSAVEAFDRSFIKFRFEAFVATECNEVSSDDQSCKCGVVI